MRKGVILHPLARFVSIDPAVGPRMPTYARLSDSGRARSKPFPHAPVFRMALVGKHNSLKLLFTTTTYYYYYHYYYYYYFSLEKGAGLTNLQAASHLVREPAVCIPFEV